MLGKPHGRRHNRRPLILLVFFIGSTPLRLILLITRWPSLQTWSLGLLRNLADWLIIIWNPDTLGWFGWVWLTCRSVCLMDQAQYSLRTDAVFRQCRLEDAEVVAVERAHV